ncbi:DUF550 domain-containing protein [Salmonella enterica subsp. enterica serovar Potsdam]|nr:hypothetical protein [Salmonella enterica subsp. enterica serovar Potsdam]EBH4540070.1 DUF550 domain-containing protein [Salmonella enterica]EBV3563104.1 hypothetical protein [Salmonella enterica subsp. enterica serovar Bareilly]EEJ7404755.1 DUF550 domain-containing protein [Salmonella enterica subsp. enterica]EBG9564603.1 DUF550 domain-containing protein [Salmonella enterica subsp. enterica serovar Potsdam]
MLDDYRERNYGHAHEWIRHIDRKFAEHSESHEDDAYSIFSSLLQGAEPVSNRDELPEEKGASLQLRNLIRQRHAEWSDKTFGNVGPVGPLKHLSKEALEAAAEPDDLSEWADMQFLLWDAQRRAGISDGEITAAMEEKLKVNMARQWPEPKDGEPRLHIKELSNSPVIPDGWAIVPVDLLSELRDWANPCIERYCEMWEGRRDSEFPALRKVIADADALIAAPQQESE